MPELTSTALGSDNITSERIVVDMSDQITLLKPSVMPLTVLSKKLNTETTHNYKFEWMEEKIMSCWSSAGADYLAGDGTIDVATDDGTLFAVNDLIKNVSTGEVMKVTAISGDTLTVDRSVGDTAAAGGTSGDKILVVGNASMQGSGAPAQKIAGQTPVYNYTQIFKTPFSVTNTLQAMKLRGGKALSRLQNKKGREHGRTIELAMFFGEKSLDLTGDQPESTTGGVVQFLSGSGQNDSISKSSGTLEDDVFDYLEQLFTYGNQKKTMFASSSVISLVTKIARDKMQLIQADKDSTYGLNVTTLLSPHGELNLIKHPLFVQGYADYAVTLDMEYVKYRPLQGRDTKLKTNIQNNDEDGRKDQYLTEAGLELRHPECHGILTLTA